MPTITIRNIEYQVAKFSDRALIVITNAMNRIKGDDSLEAEAELAHVLSYAIPKLVDDGLISHNTIHLYTPELLLIAQRLKEILYQDQWFGQGLAEAKPLIPVSAQSGLVTLEQDIANQNAFMGNQSQSPMNLSRISEEEQGVLDAVESVRRHREELNGFNKPSPKQIAKLERRLQRMKAAAQ